MFYASALFQDLEGPWRVSKFVFGSRYTIAIGEDGWLRIWNVECKLTRVKIGEQMTAIDLDDDTLLLGLGTGKVRIGQISSGIHSLGEIDLTGDGTPIHAVRIVECTKDEALIAACADNVVYVVHIQQDGSVEMMCRKPFDDDAVAAIRVVDVDDQKTLVASAVVTGRLRIASAHLQGNLSNLEQLKELVTWEDQAAHVHKALNVLDIDPKARVFVECDDSALAVIDGLTGRTYCHDLLCSSPGSVPGGSGCLFDYSGMTLIFWASGNLPELVISHITDNDYLILWQGASESLTDPLFPSMVSTPGGVGFVWRNKTNTHHAIVLHEYEVTDERPRSDSSNSSAGWDPMSWNDSGDEESQRGQHTRTTIDAADDFYKPGLSEQERPLEEIIDELRHHIVADGKPVATHEICCQICENGDDSLSS